MPHSANESSAIGQHVGRPTLWRRVRRIGWRGIVLRLEALLLLRHILRAMKLRPFKEVRVELLPTTASSTASAIPSAVTRGPARAEMAVPVGEAVASAARFVPGALCVSQALATQVLLARRGEPSVLHFGFLRSGEGDVQGHAWLEVDGSVVIGDGGLDSFTRTATFEA